MSTELPEDLADLIARLDLQPLPAEGTWFRETWRSAHGSSMIGLHAPAIGSCSRFHRLGVDETWHFHAGDPIRLVLLEPGGVHGQLLLGPDPTQGHVPQFTVPAGVWQASATVDGGRWSLYGCTCAPPFTPETYEGGTLDVLLAGWPERDADIRRFAAPVDAVRMPG